MAPDRRGRPERKPTPVEFAKEGDDEWTVPEAYRMLRGEFDVTPDDLESFRKQLMYRCGRFGTKELEIILSDWFKEYAAGLSHAELSQFDMDVLNIENP